MLKIILNTIVISPKMVLQNHCHVKYEEMISKVKTKDIICQAINKN